MITKLWVVPSLRSLGINPFRFEELLGPEWKIIGPDYKLAGLRVRLIMFPDLRKWEAYGFSFARVQRFRAELNMRLDKDGVIVEL